jgi:hypothetical protein
LNTDLDTLAQKLGYMVLSRGLGPRSIWALNVGVEAAGVEGVAGVLAIKIPPKQKDFLDVVFTAGAVDVVARWGGPS